MSSINGLGIGKSLLESSRPTPSGASSSTSSSTSPLAPPDLVPAPAATYSPSNASATTPAATYSPSVPGLSSPAPVTPASVAQAAETNQTVARESRIGIGGRMPALTVHQPVAQAGSAYRSYATSAIPVPYRGTPAAGAGVHVFA